MPESRRGCLAVEIAGILAVLVAAALPWISGCRTVNQALQKEHFPCGVYRWRVKTLTDADAGAIRPEARSGFEPHPVLRVTEIQSGVR